MQFQHRTGSGNRSGTNAIDELIDAIQKYFNLMYDCNIANFADVFSPVAQLHGYRDGKMVCWPAAEYKEVLEGAPVPALARLTAPGQRSAHRHRLGEPRIRQGRGPYPRRHLS